MESGEESNDYGNGPVKNKMRKQEVERKRRLRMANALDQIKDILQENTGCDLKKADKVEVLESTVKFLKERKQSQQEDSFCSGYNSCLVEMSGSLMTADDIDYNTKSTLLMLISKMSTTRHTAPAKKMIQDEKQRNNQVQQQNGNSKQQQIYQQQHSAYQQSSIKQEPFDNQISYLQDRQNRQTNDQSSFRQDPSVQRCNIKQHAPPQHHSYNNQSYPSNKQEYHPVPQQSNYRPHHPEPQHCNFKQPSNDMNSPLPSPVYPSNSTPQYHQQHQIHQLPANNRTPVTLQHQPYIQPEKRSPLSNIKNINPSPPSTQQVVIKKQTKGMKRCHSDTTMEKENFKKTRMEERQVAPTNTKIEFKPSPVENQAFHFPNNGSISVPANHTIDNTNIAVLQKNAEGKFTRISNIPLKALLGNIEVFKTKDLNSMSDVKIRPKQTKPVASYRTTDQSNKALSASHPNGFSFMKLLQEENIDSEGMNSYHKQKEQSDKCQVISMPPIGAYIVDSS
ncbi:probable basic-leucine zipper transcription factor Q [Clytia hemisphaerica]|uniref:BHLH domain-containing protein n=1 Tax=Clytia hemisphaerica TaxID=252671 RepID=A0A7M5V9Z8_9CNID